MSEKSLLGRFTKYVTLNVMGMIGISLYILADTFFISRALGADGLTALNFTLAIFSIMHGIGLMTGIGGASRYSISVGLGRREETVSVLMNSLYIGATAALILMTAGIFFSSEISAAMGADSSTKAYTEVYLCTMLCFAPCFLLNNIVTAFVRNDGNPGICMTATVTSSISNIVLDYVFIFILEMGMYGAVFATGLSPVISLMILTTHLRKKSCGLHLGLRKPDISRMLSIMKLGLSSLITELSSAVTVVVMNFVLLRISGNTGVAAYGIIANTALVATAVYGGISQGIQPIVSVEYGKGNRNALKKVCRYMIMTALGVAVLLVVGVYFGAEQIASAFNSGGDKVLGELAAEGLRIYFTGFLFAGVNIVSAAYFSASDMAKRAFAISALRSAVLVVPAVIILSMAVGIKGVWLSFTASEVITLAVTIYNLRKSGREAEKYGTA